MSYVEIYNEVVQDLLAAQAPMATSASSGNLVAARALYGGGSSNGTGGGGNSPRRITGAMDNGAGTAPGSPLRSGADGEGSTGGGSISIYENAAGQIVLDGVTEVPLKSSADLAMLLQRGTALRATAAHRYARGAAVVRTTEGACFGRRISGSGASIVGQRSWQHVAERGGLDIPLEPGWATHAAFHCAHLNCRIGHSAMTLSALVYNPALMLHI